MEDSKPLHLQGNFAPVKEEISAQNLEVEGAIPPDLRGLCLRKGSNPVTGHSEHWFLATAWCTRFGSKRAGRVGTAIATCRPPFSRIPNSSAFLSDFTEAG